MSRAERAGTYVAAEEMVPPLIMFVAIVVLVIFLWSAFQKFKGLADPSQFISDLLDALKKLAAYLPNIGDWFSVGGLVNVLAQLNAALSLFADDVHFAWKLNTGDSSGGNGTAQIQTGIEGS